MSRSLITSFLRSGFVFRDASLSLHALHTAVSSAAVTPCLLQTLAAHALTRPGPRIGAAPWPSALGKPRPAVAFSCIRPFNASASILLAKAPPAGQQGTAAGGYGPDDIIAAELRRLATSIKAVTADIVHARRRLAAYDAKELQLREELRTCSSEDRSRLLAKQLLEVEDDRRKLDEDRRKLEDDRRRLDKRQENLEAQALPLDQSFAALRRMLAPPPAALPATPDEMRAYLSDHSGVAIPVLPSMWESVRRTFSTSIAEAEPFLFQAKGSLPAAAAFIFDMTGTESGPTEVFTSTLMDLMWGGFLKKISIVDAHKPFSVIHAAAVKDTGRATIQGCRPDTALIFAGALLALGEDKLAGNLRGAVKDLETKLAEGFKAEAYGDVKLLLAYAAAGWLVQLYACECDGKVTSVSDVFNLADPLHRLKFMLTLLKVYVLLRAMAKALPDIGHRIPERTTVRKDHQTELLMTPTAFRKEISDFSVFAKKNHTSFDIIKHAYAAAEAATRGLPITSYFMVIASRKRPSPSLVGDVYTATTEPVGYASPSSISEMEAKDMARACCQALQALHTAGIVHRDVRLPNIVCLRPRQWMLIDYEHCGEAGAKLPADFRLHAWDGTETVPVPASDGVPLKMYDDLSDMVLLGRLLKQVCHELSPEGTEFVSKLQSRQLSAASALLESWLRPVS